MSQKLPMFILTFCIVIFSSCTNKQAKPVAGDIQGGVAPLSSEAVGNTGVAPDGITPLGNSPVQIDPQISSQTNGSGQISPFSAGVSTWQGQLAQVDPQVRVESTGQVAQLSSLQQSKAFLVVALFDTDCQFCRTKSDAFNQQSAQSLLAGSSKCSFVSVIKNSSAAYAQKQVFMQNFAVTGAESATAALYQAAFPQGFTYPATLVIDQSGTVVEARSADFGPQTALSYCI